MSRTVDHRSVLQPFETEWDGPFPVPDSVGEVARDETLRARIVAALEADPIAAPCAALMAVRCEDGAVVLGGLVDTPRLRQHVAAIVAAVDGVAAVMDRLRIRGIQLRSPFVG
jgi:osmotically-inducible protein OsmY